MNILGIIREMIKIREFIREALLESFDFDNNKTYNPPSQVGNVAKTAKKVLSNRTSPPVNENNNEGNGVNVVDSLITRQPISHPQLKRFVAFFENNKQRIEAERKLGKDATNSDIILMWQLHGGDDCMNWCNNELERTSKSNLNTKKHMRDLGGGNDGKEGMGSMSVKSLVDTQNTRTHGQNLAKR